MGMQQGIIEVTFNGETRLLRFDFNAIADVEEYFGRGIASIMDDERIGFSTIRALYWGGLKWKIKGLTIERTGQMIQKEMIDNGLTFEKLMTPVIKALQASGYMGKPKSDNDDDTETDEVEEKN